MKYFNKKSLMLALTALVGFLSMFNAAGPAAAGNGDRTGSPFATPAGGSSCNSPSCHNTGSIAYQPSFSVQLFTTGNAPVTTYVAGTTYVLRLFMTSTTNVGTTTRYGFQAVAVTTSNLANAGTWGTLPTGFHTTFANSRFYVEQNAGYVFNFVDIPWQAPVAGSGAVKFYAAGLIADNNTLATGDTSRNDSLTIPEFVPCNAPTLSATVGPVNCHNGADGSITVTPSGGTPPFNYSWTGPNGFTAGTQNLTGLAAGTYVVTASTGQCSSKDTVVLTNPTAISITGVSYPTFCEGVTATLTNTVSGGTSPYTYLWTGNNGFTSTSQVPVIPSIPVADAGFDTFIVTDAHLCKDTVRPSINVAPGIILVGNSVNPTCGGNTNGSITLTVSGSGTQPFSFAWTGPNGFTSTDPSLANIGTGTYTLTAHQATTPSCIQTYTATLTAPATVIATATVATPVCQGKVLTLTGGGSGGSGALTYHWMGPNNYQSFTQSALVSNAVPFTSSGTYTVSVTDNVGCTSNASVAVLVDTVPTVTATPVSVRCYGAATGSITTTTINGAPYTYAYSGPNSFTGTSQNISNVPAGTYTVNVTSNLGCVATQAVTITQPATPVTGFAASNTPYCPGGTLNLFGTGSGGTGAISYSWTGPGSYTSAQQSPVITPAGAANAGVYTLTVKDANNCSFLTTTTAAQSVPPLVTTTVTGATCNGYNNGSIQTTVNGGAPPFTYSWIGPNGYTSSAPNPTNLAAGSYSVSVNGICTGAGTNTTTVPQPAAIKDSIYANNPVCNGTLLNFNANVSGGAGGYNYSWTGPNGFIANTINPSIPSVTLAASGQYTLVVVDANNCIKATPYTVTVDTVPVIHQKDTSYCPGATVTLNAGNGGAAYLWNTGATTQSINAGTAGTYTISVTNAYGCPATKAIQVAAASKPSVDSIGATVVANNPGGYNFVAVNPKAVTAYVWNFGDGSSTALPAAWTHYYAATGTYNVTLLAVNTCGVDTLNRSVTVTAVTGVANVANGTNAINVYPNPTRDYVMIENTNGVAIKSIKVINVLGAKIYEGKIDNQMYRMNTATFTPGIYTLYIETAEGTAVRKLEVLK